MASPAPSRPTPREPDRRRCRRPPTTPQPQVAHPPGEPPDSSFLSPSRWFAPIRCHRAIIQLPDLGLMLAQRGAAVTGLDFSGPAIDVARGLASELGLADRARFVHADLYDALEAMPAPHQFDLVFVTWGAICWLPDIALWAAIVAALLRPGGSLFLAEGHPAAYVFDDEAGSPEGMPGWFAPYFSREPIMATHPGDYVDTQARL